MEDAAGAGNGRFSAARPAAEHARVLLEINNAVIWHLDLRELLKSITSSLRRIIPNDAAFLTLCDAEGSEMRVQALDLQSLDNVPFEEGVQIPMAGTPEGEAIAVRKPVLVTPGIDVTRCPSPWVKKAIETGVKSGCAVPLIAHGHPLGVLSGWAAPGPRR